VEEGETKMSGRGDMNGDLIAGRRVTRMSGNDAAYNSSGVKEVNDGQRLKKVGKQLAGLTKYGKDGVLALLKVSSAVKWIHYIDLKKYR